MHNLGINITQYIESVCIFVGAMFLMSRSHTTLGSGVTLNHHSLLYTGSMVVLCFPFHS